MTHEREPNDEAEGGPQNDDRLPHAEDLEVAVHPFALPPVDHPDEWDE